MGNTSSTTNFDPYEILGLERDADLEEIKLAFKLKAKRLHPDRNKGKPDYEEKLAKFKLVQLAYEILSDNSRRKQYDQEYGSTYGQLKNASERYISEQEKKLSKDEIKKQYYDSGKFDTDTFNKQFQEARKSYNDPNDVGYGDEMAPRLDESQVKGGMRRDNPDKPKRLFKDKHFSNKEFNQLFEYYKDQHKSQHGLIEKSDAEPIGFNLGPQTGFTDIALYGGAMIVGKDMDDFSSMPGENSSLFFSDYKQGFHGFSNTDEIPTSELREQIEQEKKYGSSDAALSESDFNQLLQERRREHAQKLVPEIPKGERNKSFVMAEQLYLQKKKEQLQQEQEQNKKVVLKYKDQFPQHLLEDLSLNDNNNNDISPNSDPRMQRSISDLMRERNSLDMMHSQPPQPQQSHTPPDKRMQRTLNDVIHERTMPMNQGPLGGNILDRPRPGH